MRRAAVGRAARIGLVVAVVALLAAGAYSQAVRPSTHRTWVPEQARTPEIDREGGDVVVVRNVRDCPRGPGMKGAAPRWETRRLDLSQLDSLWFVLSPFRDDWRGPAHPFLSFGFGDTTFVAVSIEARKEPGERYSIWRGLLRTYELMYVVADERDVLGLRVFEYDDDVFVYPVRTSPERTRALFLDMLETAQALGERPEFYHTVWNNCTTNLVDHANRVSTKRIPGGLRVLFPGYTDEIARSLDLLETDDDLETMRARHLVNDRVRAAWGRPDFHRTIREEPPVAPPAADGASGTLP